MLTNGQIYKISPKGTYSASPDPQMSLLRLLRLHSNLGIPLLKLWKCCYAFTPQLRLPIALLAQGHSIMNTHFHYSPHPQAEHMNRGYLLDLVILVPVALIWAILPSDLLAMASHWLLNMVVTLFISLPYSRTLESEADQLGLRLAAKVML